MNPNNSNHPIIENSTYRWRKGPLSSFFAPTTVSSYCHGRCLVEGVTADGRRAGTRSSLWSLPAQTILWCPACGFAIHPLVFWLLLAVGKESTEQSKGTIFLPYHSLIFSVWIWHTDESFFSSLLLLISFLGHIRKKTVTCCSVFHTCTQGSKNKW